MTLEIRPIPEADTDVWDDLVERSPHGSIFHSSSWVGALGGGYDLWGVYSGDDLQAGFVAPVRQLMGVRVPRNPYLTKYSGLVVANGGRSPTNQLSFESRVVTALAPFLKSTYRWGRMTLDPRVAYVIPFLWEGFTIHPRFTYVLTLSDMESVWKGMQHAVRSDVSKARRSGLSVVHEQSADRLLPLLRLNYRRLGMTLQEEALSKYIAVLSEQNRFRTFLCLDANGKETATCMIMWDSRKAYAVFNAQDDSEGHRGAVSLCIYESIKYATEVLGLEVFDFTGSMIPSIERFLRHFGGRVQSYYELRWGSGIDFLLKSYAAVGKYLHSD